MRTKPMSLLEVSCSSKEIREMYYNHVALSVVEKVRTKNSLNQFQHDHAGISVIKEWLHKSEITEL